MIPGTQMTYRGVDGKGAVSTIVVTVTDKTKRIAKGISARVVRDTAAIEPDSLEYKCYAPGVGTVLTLDISGDSGRDELIKVTQVPAGTAIGPLGRPD